MDAINQIVAGFFLAALYLILIIISVFVLDILEKLIPLCVKKIKLMLSAVYVVYYMDTRTQTESYATVYAFNKAEANMLFRQRRGSRYKILGIERT